MNSPVGIDSYYFLNLCLNFMVVCMTAPCVQQMQTHFKGGGLEVYESPPPPSSMFFKGGHKLL